MFWISVGLVLFQSLWNGVIVTAMASFLQILTNQFGLQQVLNDDHFLSRITAYIGELVPNNTELVMLVGTTVSIFLGSVIYMGMFMYTSLFQVRFVSELRKSLFNDVIHAKVSYFDSEKKGNLLQILIWEARGCYAVYKTGSKLLVDISNLVVYSVFIFLLSWELSLVVVAVGILVVAVVRWITIHIKSISVFSLKQRSNLMARAEEVLSGIRAVKVLNLYNRSERLFNRSNRLAEQSRWKYGVLAQTTVVLSSFGGLICILLLLAINMRYGLMPISIFIVFLYVLVKIGGDLSALNQDLSQFVGYLPSIEKTKQIKQMLQNEREVTGHLISRPLFKRAIRFGSVNLSYPGREDVLTDINLTIYRNQSLAIVGPSGAGKTSLVHLLVKLYTPSSGSITFDDVSISDIETGNLRNQIGMVSQDGYIFHGTVRENLLLGRSSSTDEDIYQAAARAQASEFIESLPQRYDTLLGDQGVNLSGGQKQRIQIAQMLLKDPDIIVLDEATSALDTETEEKFRETLSTLIQNKTLIVIAHRLSTVRSVDRIVVLDKGRIVETGTWDHLMGYESLFKDMVDRQRIVLS